MIELQDGDADGFATTDGLLAELGEAGHIGTAVGETAFDGVFAHKDAAESVVRGVATVDEDGGETWHVVDEGHVDVMFGPILYADFVGAFGDGGAAIDFDAFNVVGRHVGGETAVGVFEGVGELGAIDVHAADGVAGTGRVASDGDLQHRDRGN